MVRYKVKPGEVERNEELVRAVYAELHRVKPDGLRYATFRLEDAVSFVHVASQADAGRGPLPGLQAFRRFQEGIDARCDERPVVAELHVIGSYP